LLKRSAPSRILNVTCKPYKFANINFSDINSSKEYNEKAAYDQSKLANAMFTDKLAELLRDSKVTVNAVDPGYAFTELQRHSSMFRSSVSGVTVTPVVKTFMKTPQMAAQSVIYAVASPDLQQTSGKIIT
jgi:NAD(P)-dependent dehydrogenase (short-subunit alcohol dehydrogenase family)